LSVGYDGEAFHQTIRLKNHLPRYHLLAIQDDARYESVQQPTIYPEPDGLESQYGGNNAFEDSVLWHNQHRAAEVEDWALQGVDMALFDNLIRAAAEPSADPSMDSGESRCVGA
jgi:hypothetical protein